MWRKHLLSLSAYPSSIVHLFLGWPSCAWWTASQSPGKVWLKGCSSSPSSLTSPSVSPSHFLLPQSASELLWLGQSQYHRQVFLLLWQHLPPFDLYIAGWHLRASSKGHAKHYTGYQEQHKSVSQRAWSSLTAFHFFLKWRKSVSTKKKHFSPFFEVHLWPRKNSVSPSETLDALYEPSRALHFPPRR